MSGTDVTAVYSPTRRGMFLSLINILRDFKQRIEETKQAEHLRGKGVALDTKSGDYNETYRICCELANIPCNRRLWKAVKRRGGILKPSVGEQMDLTPWDPTPILYWRVTPSR